MPLLRLILPVASIPGALAIGTEASSVSRIVLFRRHIRWGVVRRFVPRALPAAGLRAFLLTRFEPAYVEFLLACFLLLNLPALFRRAPFGLLGRPTLIAAVLASFAARPLLSLMRESVFRRAGLGAMVASGLALLSLSGSQIMALHQAWIVYAADEGDEREVQLYWGGVRYVAFVREEDGRLVVERTVAIETLPHTVRAALPSIAPRETIVLVEEVRGLRTRSYAVYHRDGSAIRGADLAAEGVRLDRET